MLTMLIRNEVCDALSLFYGLPALDLEYFQPDPAVLALIQPETAVRYKAIPISRVGATLTVALADPTDLFALDFIRFQTGFHVEPIVAAEQAIEAALVKYYLVSDSETEVEVVEQEDERDYLTLNCMSDAPAHVENLMSDCVKEAQQHVLLRRQPAVYVVNEEGNESFAIRAQRLINEAMRTK